MLHPKTSFAVLGCLVRRLVPLCSIALLAGACTGTSVFGDAPDAAVADAGADVGGGGGDDAAAQPDVAPQVDANPDVRDTSDLTVADAAADVPSDGDLVDLPDGSADTGGEPNPELRAIYPDDTLLSPITAYVAERMLEAASNNENRQWDVFMKVGASGTVSTNLLYCFAGDAQPQYVLDLDGRDELMPSIAYFRGGDAAGDTPFDRPTLAAVSGRTARWVITGDPSPLEREIAAINPRFAFVNYGTNDMQQGTTHQSALWPFYSNFSALLDQTLANGIIPIVSGLNPRDDSQSALYWVPTYNVVTRGVAQARQVPYMNMYLAMKDLPDMGLVSDGIHGNVYSADGREPCVFTDEGLTYNYNLRNLLSMQMLLRVLTVMDGSEDPDPSGASLLGDGSPDDPFAIDALPFTHMADTGTSPNRLLDGYPDCDTGQDESGPEHYYRFELASETRVRLMVFDDAGVDIDVHLLAGDSNGICLERNDRIVQGPLPAGSYVVSLDSYVPSDGDPRDGEYLFVILACEPGDPACD